MIGVVTSTKEADAFGGKQQKGNQVSEGRDVVEDYHMKCDISCAELNE